MKTLLMVFACAVPLAAQSGTSSSSKSDSAKAAAVVARHTAAIGGAAAIHALKHVHTVMTTSIVGVAGAPEVRSEMFAKAPNLVYMKMDMPGLGVMEMGYDGKTVWSMSAATGPIIHDEVPQQVLDAANFAEAPLSGLKISYAGRRQIGGRSYEAVRAITPDSQSMTNYFDVETGLLSGMDPDGGPPPAADRMTVTFDDYKRFGGILQATKITTVAPQGQEMVVRTVSLSHAPFDAKVFEPPAAVRQLRDKPPQR